MSTDTAPGPYAMHDPVKRAGLLVEVYAVGEPGVVAMRVVNLGPVKLTRDEAARLLREATEQIEVTWPAHGEVAASDEEVPTCPK